MVILDDKEARATAATLSVPYVGTAGVMLKARLEGHWTLAELEESVGELSKVIWISPGVVAEILRRAREAKR